MFFGYRNVDIFPTITNKETYVAGGGVQQNRVLPGFRRSPK